MNTGKLGLGHLASLFSYSKTTSYKICGFSSQLSQRRIRLLKEKFMSLLLLQALQLNSKSSDPPSVEVILIFKVTMKPQ